MPLYDSSVLINSMGVARTQSLFREYCREGETPIFTVSNNPKDGCLQLKNVYMDFCVDDPTEYDFANHVFGSYKHWKKIADSSWFQDHLLEWREEAAIRRKSEAFKAIVKDVRAGRNALVSGKYLIEEPWAGKGAKAQSSRYKTTREAYNHVRNDIDRLKQEGLIN